MDYVLFFGFGRFLVAIIACQLNAAVCLFSAHFKAPIIMWDRPKYLLRRERNAVQRTWMLAFKWKRLFFIFTIFIRFMCAFLSRSFCQLKRQYIMHFDRAFVIDLSRCMSINARIKYRLVMRSVLSISHYRSLRAFNHILIEAHCGRPKSVEFDGAWQTNEHMHNIWTHKLRTKSMHWIS